MVWRTGELYPGTSSSGGGEGGGGGEPVFSSTVPACALELPRSGPVHAPEAAFTLNLSCDRGPRMWDGSP